MELALTQTTRNENELLFVGSPRQWRADCQAGQFKIGSSRMVGPRLRMEVIAAKFIEDELFGYEWQKWLNVIFADPDGVVSSIMFKTESMDNFLEVYRESLATETPLTQLVIEAAMSKRASKESGNGYYAVEFAVGGPGKYSLAVAAFREALPDGIYRIGDNGSKRPDAEYQPAE